MTHKQNQVGSKGLWAVSEELVTPIFKAKQTIRLYCIMFIKKPVICIHVTAFYIAVLILIT
jgi:hypothetical protein